MKINIKARLKNKTWVLSMATLIVAFIYQILSAFEIVPKISEDTVTNTIIVIVNMLGALGVLIDPTTNGINDSDRAMTYYTENDEREEVSK